MTLAKGSIILILSSSTHSHRNCCRTVDIEMPLISQVHEIVAEWELVGTHHVESCIPLAICQSLETEQEIQKSHITRTTAKLRPIIYKVNHVSH